MNIKNSISRQPKAIRDILGNISMLALIILLLFVLEYTVN